MCSLSRADGTTTIARRSTYFQVLVRYRSVGLGETGLHVGLGGGLWEAVDEGRLLRLQLPICSASRRWPRRPPDGTGSASGAA